MATNKIKKQKVGKTPTNPAKIIFRFIRKYSFAIAIIIVSVGLATSVFLLNYTLRYAYGGKTATSSNSSSQASFDQNTINTLSSYNESSSNQNYQALQSGRIDPFSE